MKKTEKQLRENLKRISLTLHEQNECIRLFKECEDEVAAFQFGEYLKDIKEGKIERRFIFQTPSEIVKKRGVYKIEFGEDTGKFYVGRSKYIATRLKQHERELKKLFKDGSCPANHYLRKVFIHLNDDLLAWVFPIELLEECATTDELTEREQFWLDKYKDDPNCLNVGFTAYKVQHEINESCEEQKARKYNPSIAWKKIFYYRQKR